MGRFYTLFFIACLGLHVLAQSVDSRSAIVLYDNDVHCQINGYPVMAGLRDSLQQAGIATLMVSGGDFAQGGVYGAISKGQYCVDAMNAAQYDVVNLGNHEFDYGGQQMMNLMNQMTSDVICSNLYDAANHRVFQPYSIKTVGGIKVAFVGVLTPLATREEYYAFEDKQGNALYSLCRDSLVQVIQRNIDEVRAQNPDFVIAMLHIGEKGSPTSAGLIAQLTGVDVVLDGHSHTVNESEYIKDADNHDVLLTQTGTKFQKIGKLTLTVQGDNRVATCELLDTMGISHSSQVDDVIRNIYADAASLLNKKVGYTAYDLTISRPDGSRAVRQEETNIGDMVADAYRIVLQAQIGLCNGGGVRASIPQGDITYQQIVDVSPFANDMCVLSVSGQQLMDFTEYMCRFCPQENGDFMQISGLRYTIDTTIHNQQKIEDEQWCLTGERRVYDFYIWDGQDWQPLQPDEAYSVATSSYVAGLAIMKKATVLLDKVMVDQDALVQYVTDTLGGQIPTQYADVQGRILFADKPSGMESISMPHVVRKQLINGRIYIRKGQMCIDILGNQIH
ncbi:MAG: bifunctional metallophosphatase/5'-nucleotidase [Paludibacteraceae bacterium]|nr:bifunctional metallophosphatase/5'-nucleotidase [Paludibacteraceae bacterium]